MDKKSESNHNHDDRYIKIGEITGLDNYVTKEELELELDTKSDIDHTHDDLYMKKEESSSDNYLKKDTDYFVFKQTLYCKIYNTVKILKNDLSINVSDAIQQCGYYSSQIKNTGFLFFLLEIRKQNFNSLLYDVGYVGLFLLTCTDFNAHNLRYCKIDQINTPYINKSTYDGNVSIDTSSMANAIICIGKPTLNFEYNIMIRTNILHRCQFE